MAFALPGKHNKQALCPGDGWKAPCEQGVQTCWPGIGEKVPIATQCYRSKRKTHEPVRQTSQVTVCVDDANRPGSHLKQDDRPVTLPCVPTGHTYKHKTQNIFSFRVCLFIGSERGGPCMRSRLVLLSSCRVGNQSTLFGLRTARSCPRCKSHTPWPLWCGPRAAAWPCPLHTEHTRRGLLCWRLYQRGTATRTSNISK